MHAQACSNYYELWARRLGFNLIAGVDEAGRGPLAGPVVASAVILPENFFLDALADSKQISPKKRELLQEEIFKKAISIGIGVVDNNIIDKINIHQATLEAMKQAILNLMVKPTFLLVDGIFSVPIPIPQRTIIKGDTISQSIASASIIAKVHRDSLMREYHNQFPVYNFGKHKGYGTKEHIEAISRYGPCEIHRKTFSGVLR